MATVQEELDGFVLEELKRFEGVALARLATSLKERNVVLSGETLASLQGEVLKGTQLGTAQLLMAFKESGRIQDMGKVFWKKMPPVSVLEDYVRKVGVGKFAYVPGYEGRKAPTESVAIKRIAWGIALHRLDDNAHKPKKWYAKPFYSLLNGLIDSLVTRTQQATGQIIGGSFNIN